MFRRKPRPILRAVSEAVWPRGGWGRASRYMLHRLRRLPDPPHRVGRGVLAGIVISFTPFFGAHFIGGLALAWAIGGNLLASALATFLVNPVTLPFIAVMSVTLGRWMLGMKGWIGPQQIVAEIARASEEFGRNVLAIAGGEHVDWNGLSAFWHDIFLPYLVGGIGPGILAGLVGHALTVPLVRAYHRRRADRAARRAGLARLRRGAAPDGGARPGALAPADTPQTGPGAPPSG